MATLARLALSVFSLVLSLAVTTPASAQPQSAARPVGRIWIKDVPHGPTLPIIEMTAERAADGHWTLKYDCIASPRCSEAPAL